MQESVSVDHELGTPPFDRRLSDKSLAAFNHAYASGAHQVAVRLKTLLVEVDDKERVDHERRAASAVSQAELWIAFVEARDAYNGLMEKDTASENALETALEAMKTGYQAWSKS